MAYRFVCLPLSARQSSAFNQPLSFDTSKVTNMNSMFAGGCLGSVADSNGACTWGDHVPCPQLNPSLNATCATRCPTPSHIPAHMPPASYAALSARQTRQAAVAYNQPLSLDTSSVNDMSKMFQVRSARALPPTLKSGLPPCTLLAPPSPHAFPCPGPRVARFICLPFRLGRARRRSISC